MNNFMFAYLLRKKGSKGWRTPERVTPKMPSILWRVAAVCCAALGAVLAWLIFRGSAATGWRMVGGAIVGFVVGMYAVESIWERRIAQAQTGITAGSQTEPPT